MLSLLALLAQAVSAPIPADVAAWSTFRGPSGRGVVAAPHPDRWSDESNIAWKVEVPGGGWSSPVVANGVVYVTTAVQTAKEDGGRPLGFAGGARMPESRGTGAPKPEGDVIFQLRAYDLSNGELKWQKELARRVPDRGVHPSNSYATETPVTDGDRVVCYFGAIGLMTCVDTKGEVVWTQELGAFPTNADFGTASALATAAGNVFVQCDNDESSFVAAFRLTDGEPAWRVERPRGSAWASPIAWTHGDATDLVVCGPGTVTGYSPTTGDARWVVDVGGTFSSSPAIDGDLLIVGNSGRMQRGPLLAIEASVEGEIDADDEDEDSPIAWNVSRAGPSFASPVAVNGMVWIINSQGILTCRDAATGEELYDERLPDLRQVVSCPWTDGDNVYILGESGRTYVVAATPEFELVATNQVEGTFWATPSAADGNLLLRSVDSLICIRAAQ